MEHIVLRNESSMASIVPGFEYDIFISYRQKDNLGSHWVSEFVEALKTELESTLKEEISVYFDINPHYGILETYDVDASLKEKLKCLIFIPVISRTYCDPRSFAWEHEFKAFVEMASKDQFGLKVKLPNGNVASRVLPVKIYDLRPDEIAKCESLIQGFLRGIEFVYKEPGINRPLKTDDDEKNNLNKTKYRNQINKLGNAIGDLIEGMLLPRAGEVQKDFTVSKTPRRKKKILYPVLGFITIFLPIVWLIIHQGDSPPEKTIAVLPFINLSDDPDQEHFCDGMTITLLNNLFSIGGLEISSSSSSMAFKTSKLSLPEKARSLNVKYLIEGNVTKAGDNVRIFVNLLNGNDGRVIWGKQYDTLMNVPNILGIHSEVARQVARELSVRLDPQFTGQLFPGQTSNYEAFDLLLRARNPNATEDRQALLEKAIILDPHFADAYASLAMYFIWSGGHGQDLSREIVIEKAQPLIEKALEIDNNSIMGHYAMAYLMLFYFWDFERVRKEYETVKRLSPSNSDVRQFFIDFLLASGEKRKGLRIARTAFKRNKNDPGYWQELALSLFYNGDEEKAMDIMEQAMQLHHSNFIILNTVRIYVYSNEWQQAIKTYSENYIDSVPYFKIPYFGGLLGISYFKAGEPEKADSCLQELLKAPDAKGSPSFFAAGVYTAMNRKDEALKMLQIAFNNKEVEMYWLKVEPMFRPLHGDPQFEDLLTKMGLSNKSGQ